MDQPYSFAARDRCLKLLEVAKDAREKGDFNIQIWWTTTADCGTGGCFGGYLTILYPEEIWLRKEAGRNYPDWPERNDDITMYGCYEAIGDVLGISGTDAKSFCNSRQTNNQAFAAFETFIEKHWPGSII